MEKISWIKLKSVPNIGNYTFKRLIDIFKTPIKVFEASHKELISVKGITDKTARNILKYKTLDSVKREYELTIEKKYQIVTMADKEYPTLLLDIPDPPPFLYVAGKLNNKMDSIAIVGSRNATNYGIINAKRISKDIAGLKIQVVSGMARGIDTAAHKGALAGNGKTIAVLGSGLENIYPAENKKLFCEIKESGAVISEFSLLKAPEPQNFPIRNRIISGMSLGVVVVEASKKSGSLITARIALEQGREVFAIPGSINSFKSMGAHHLLKQGANLVEGAFDIVENLKFLLKSQSVDSKKESTSKIATILQNNELKVLKHLNSYEEHIDNISKRLEMDIATLLGILTKLELKGLVFQSSGKMFSKI